MTSWTVLVPLPTLKQQLLPQSLSIFYSTSNSARLSCSLRLHIKLTACQVACYTPQLSSRTQRTSPGRRLGSEGALCLLLLPGLLKPWRLKEVFHKTLYQRDFRPPSMLSKRERSCRLNLAITSLRPQKHIHSYIQFRNGSPHLGNLPASTRSRSHFIHVEANGRHHHQLDYKFCRLPCPS